MTSGPQIGHTKFVITARLVVIATTIAIAVPVAFAFATNSSFSRPTLAEVADAVGTFSPRTLSKVDSLTIRVLGEHTEAAVANDPAFGQDIPDLANKLDSTAETLNRLSLDFQKAVGEVNLLDLKWESLQSGEVNLAADALVSDLEFDGRLAWLNNWGWPEVRNVVSSVTAARESLGAVRGVDPVAYAKLKSAAADLGSAQEQVGDAGDTADEQTVHGRYKQVQELATALAVQRGQLTGLLDQWDSMPSSQRESKAEEAAEAVLALNQIQGAGQWLAGEPKTKIQDLAGLVRVNESLLAQDANTPVVGTWYEENPLIIRTLVTNPSATALRNIGVKYYLPAEIKGKDIISHDAGLEVKYDSGRRQYYVEGEVALAAQDTKVLGVQVTDARAEAFRQASFGPAAKVRPEFYPAGWAGGVLLAGIGAVVIGMLLLVPAPSGRRTSSVRQFRGFSEVIGSSDL